jgi:hypothetical protein
MASEPKKLEFLPATPIPLEITVEQRIQLLKRVLDPNDAFYVKGQAPNVHAVIKLHEDGKLKIGEEKYLRDGEIAGKDERKLGTYFWFSAGAGKTRLSIICR